MSNDKRIILNDFLRVGDVVVVQRAVGYDYSYLTLPPDGTVATVLYIKKYMDYVDSDECWHQQPEPGVYERYGAVIYVYRDADGEWCQGTLDAAHLVFQDETLDKETRRSDDDEDRRRYGVRVGPLPELTFSVGDRVRVEDGGRQPEFGVIADIRYENVGKRNDNDRPMGYLDVRIDEGGTVIGLRDSNVTLISRGNHYYYRRGELDKLVFADLREEASFYSSVGKDEQLRSEQSGDYSWSMEDALEAIRQGKGDVIRRSGGMFGSAGFPTLYRYPELPDLGRRLREETLKGFATQATEA